MDLKLFISTFLLILVAELPDKTAFAVLLMSTKTNIWSLFTGVCAAFAIQSFVAVSFGSALTYFPEKWVHFASGVLFLIFAVFAFLRKDEPTDLKAENPQKIKFSWRSVWASFLVIFIAEWGDITQLATASLQAKYNSSLTIFLSSTLALWTVTGMAIFIGNRLKHLLSGIWLNRMAGSAFALVGLYLLLSWFKT